MFDPQVYNELASGNGGGGSYLVKAAIEFPLFGPTWMLKADWRHWQYAHNSNFGPAGCAIGTLGCNTVVGSDPNYQPGLCPSHDPGCVTNVGYQATEAYNGLGQIYVPGFTAQQSDIDARLGLKVADPRIYIGVGGYWNNYRYLGYPRLAGAGFGIDKLPDFQGLFTWYGSAWYYPSVSGNYTYPNSVFLGPLSGITVPLSYSVLKYDMGLTLNFGQKSGFYFNAGYQGEKFNPKSNAPSPSILEAPYVGIGFHF